MIEKKINNFDEFQDQRNQVFNILSQVNGFPQKNHDAQYFWKKYDNKFTNKSTISELQMIKNEKNHQFILEFIKQEIQQRHYSKDSPLKENEFYKIMKVLENETKVEFDRITGLFIEQKQPLKLLSNKQYDLQLRQRLQAVYKFIKNNDSFPESIRNLIQRINIQLGHIKKKKQKVERAQSVQQQQKKKKKIINLFKKEDSDKSPLSSESSEDSDDDNEDPQVIRPKTSNLQQKGNKDKKITIVAIPDDQSKRPKTVDNRLQAHRNSKLLQNLEAFQILNKANQPKVKSKFKDEFSKDKGISIWSYFQQKYGMTMKFTESEQIQNTKQKSKLLSDLTGVHDNQGQQNNTGQNSTGKFSQASPCLVKQSVVKQYENNRQQQKTQDDMTSPRMTRQSSNQQSNIKSVNKYSTFYSNQRQSQGQNEIKGQSKEYVTNLQGKTSFLEDVKNQRHRAVQQINDQQRLDLKMSLRKKNSFYHSSDSEIEEDRQEKRVIVHNLLKSNFNTNNEVNVGKVFEPNFDLRDQLEDRGLWQPKPAKIPIKKVVKKKKVQQNLQYEDKHDIYNIIKIAISDQKKLTKIKDFNNRQRKQFFETIKDMDPDFLDDCIQMEEIGQKKKDYNKNILEKVKIVTPNSFRRTKDNRLIIIPPNTQLSKNDVKLRYMEYYVDQALQRLNLC